jgi:hypothetical protein
MLSKQQSIVPLKIHQATNDVVNTSLAYLEKLVGNTTEQKL